LNSILTVNNDGIHDPVSVTGPAQSLPTGPLRITVDFFDYMGLDNLIVEYTGPDTKETWTVIDADALKSTGKSEEGELELIIYPNPGSNGITQVNIHGGTGDPVTITITDAMGKKVREYFLTEVGVDHLTVTDLNVQSGLYIITANQNGKLSSKRLTVVR
jgi:hypothetical protein